MDLVTTPSNKFHQMIHKGQTLNRCNNFNVVLNSTQVTIIIQYNIVLNMKKKSDFFYYTYTMGNG